MASYDIMWISKASADQRAGRAGRTGPGHCYRLYSSSLYSRQMDDFGLPEVLVRPLEDVVLAMKAMKISSVSSFPFVTPPAMDQLEAAMKLLGNLGCLNTNGTDGEGEITRLGEAISRLPLGARYGKMLLTAAQADVLDHAIAVVAALSESNPFVQQGQTSRQPDGDEEAKGEEAAELLLDGIVEEAAPVKKRWHHKGGDGLAMMLAEGAYAFAGREAGGISERVACRKFCVENGLSEVVMERIHKSRLYLANLVQRRFPDATGSVTLSDMKPPNKLQENLLKQVICSGLLDNVAMLAPVGSISGQHPYSLRSAYMSCTLSSREPLFMDRNSVLFSRDSRRLPQWVCFESLQRKTLKDGTPISVMKNLTPIDPVWLGPLAKGSNMLRIGEPVPTPQPVYDKHNDKIVCSALTKYGVHGWEIPPIRVVMHPALLKQSNKGTIHFDHKDSFRWFARFLLEGKVLPELSQLTAFLNDSPSLITRRQPTAKVSNLVSRLVEADINSASSLQRHWKEVNDKFLFRELKSWIRSEDRPQAIQVWIAAVKANKSSS